MTIFHIALPLLTCFFGIVTSVLAFRHSRNFFSRSLIFCAASIFILFSAQVTMILSIWFRIGFQATTSDLVTNYSPYITIASIALSFMASVMWILYFLTLSRKKTNV